MSAVRMCDKCEKIFSERSVGWSTGQQTRMIMDDNHRRIAASDNIDLCRTCTNGYDDDPEPRAVMASKSDAVDSEATETKAKQTRMMDK